MKKGFTLAESLVCTAILGILLVATIPFLTTVKTKQYDNEVKQKTLMIELSDINNALSSNSIEDLQERDTDNIRIEKLDNTGRLYKVTGETSKIIGYIVIKEVA